MIKIHKQLMEDFRRHLKENERSENTIKKYVRDVQHFMRFAGEEPIEKGLLVRYKELLSDNYAVSAVNSMLASLNAFLRFLGHADLCIRHIRCQKKAYCSDEQELTKDEYIRLIQAAVKEGDERMALVIQTVCGTGIRVGELQYITVEAVLKGEATVSCKGKVRIVFIVSTLREKLLQYAQNQGIKTGSLFVTKGGQPLDRSNVWRKMKMLCCLADVSPTKVYPHNLRHLFARTFYEIEKDLAKLADVLGHSNINTTRVYIITTGKEHRKRMEEMHLVI